MKVLAAILFGLALVGHASAAPVPVVPSDLVVVDAEDNVVGPVAHFADGIPIVGWSNISTTDVPIVFLREGARIVRLYVEEERLTSETIVFFNTVDCSGQPFTGGPGSHPFFRRHALYAGGAWQARPGSVGREIRVRSVARFDGTCEVNPDHYVQAGISPAYPALRVMDLPAWTAPFRIR